MQLERAEGESHKDFLGRFYEALETLEGLQEPTDLISATVSAIVEDGVRTITVRTVDRVHPEA